MSCDRVLEFTNSMSFMIQELCDVPRCSSQYGQVQTESVVMPGYLPQLYDHHCQGGGRGELPSNYLSLPLIKYSQRFRKCKLYDIDRLKYFFFFIYVQLI